MEPDRRCAKCGQAIPWGEPECPLCSERFGYFWSQRRDTFLILVFVFIVLQFVITGYAVRRFHGVERGLAQGWYSRGEQALKSNHAEAALADFRNALAYSRDVPLYQLRLAQALVATGRVQEGRTYLLSLRERQLGNGPVNLELARLAVRDHDSPEAVQYFHDAVYSDWDGNPAVQRRAVRLELVDFLLHSDQQAAARAELIAVATNLPPDAKMQTQVGALLMKAGGYDDALRLFRQALAAEPRSAPALVGAGECYFQTGQYAQAQRYLNRALQQDPKLTPAAAMRDTARAVLDLDPFIPRLGEQERGQRAREAFDQAMTRLEACAAQRGIDLQSAHDDPLHTLYAQATTFQPSMRQRSLSRDSELLSNTMDLVFEMEKAASQVCGEPQGLDLALVLIARQQEGGRP